VSDDLGDRTYNLIYAPLEGTIDQRNDALIRRLDITPTFWSRRL
jgi:hypothetical protein